MDTETLEPGADWHLNRVSLCSSLTVRTCRLFFDEALERRLRLPPDLPVAADAPRALAEFGV